jgi:hypothetical protein
MNIKEKIILLNKLIRNEENKDIYSTEKRDYLQNEIYTLKRKILMKFGLPVSNRNYDIFNDLTHWSSASPELVEKNLTEAANRYHSIPPHTTEQLIEMFKSNQIDYSDLLGELRYYSHLYTRFLCEQLLKSGKISTEEFIVCLRLTNCTQTLSKLGILVYTKNPEEFSKLKSELKFTGYLDEYINHFKKVN